MCYEIPVRQILEARISSPFKAGVRPFQLQAAERREHTGQHICELDQNPANMLHPRCSCLKELRNADKVYKTHDIGQKIRNESNQNG